MLEHLVAQRAFLQVVEEALGLALAGRRAPRAAPASMSFSTFATVRVVLELALDAHGIGERRRATCLDVGLELGVDLRPRASAAWCGRLPWRARRSSRQMLLDGGVRGLERLTASSSVTSLAPASTITMPSLVPATTRSSWLCLRCGKVGLTMNWPSTRPTRTRGDRSSRPASPRAPAPRRRR